MAKRISKSACMDAIAQKLSDPKIKQMLMYGPLSASSAPLRDEVGVNVTFSNILQVAENMLDKNGGDMLAGSLAMANFSQISYGDISDVATVGAIDVDINVMANSLIPFTCVDRAMADPIDTIWYSNLVAVDDYGDFKADQIVSGNFLPPLPVNMQLRSSGSLSFTAGSGTGVLDLQGAGYVGGSVKASVSGTVTVGGETFNFSVSGSDLAKDGNVYFAPQKVGVNDSTDIIVSASGTINSSTGAVSITVSSTGTTPTVAVTANTVSAQRAGMKNVNGNGILKMRPDYVALQLVTEPLQFIYQDNEATAMYMNRILARSAKVGGTSNLTNLHFKRITDLYTECVNRFVVGALIDMADALGDSVVSTLDVTEYTLTSSFSETKNDKISQLVIDANTAFLTRNNINASVIVCGSKFASYLMNVTLKFVAGPNAMTQLNGFIGTFNGQPVFRHNFIDQVVDNRVVSVGSDSYKAANFYLCAKLPDNSSGSMVYGEFIPLSRTAQAQNFNNPMQNSTGWFAQNAVKPIQSSLVQQGRLLISKE